MQHTGGKIPNIVSKGQTITQVLCDLSDESKQENHISTFYDGMILGFLCHNAITKVRHVERDCSYTLVSVPFHEDSSHICNEDYVFEFWFNKKRKIQIQLKPGVVLYYNGYGIMHRQVSLMPEEFTSNFWNISTYANKGLHDNVLESFRHFLD